MFLPFTNSFTLAKRGSEQRKRHSIQSSQLLDSYRKSVERIKEKSTKLYPFLKYNADQMTDFVEEISLFFT